MTVLYGQPSKSASGAQLLPDGVVEGLRYPETVADKMSLKCTS